jgi:integrase
MDNEGLDPALLYTGRRRSQAFASVQFIFVVQRVMFSGTFACVRRPPPKAGNFVATVLRRTEQKEDERSMTGSGETRNAAALTTKAIEAMRPNVGGAYRVPDVRAKGLALRVAPTGSKTWDLSYRVKGFGKVKRLSLGRVSDVSLEQARDRAHQLTSAARRGVDLIAEEEEAREAKAREITVKLLIERYLARRVVGRLKTSKEIEARLRRALAPIMTRKVLELRRRDLRELFDAAVDEGHEREAEKRRQTTGAMFRWGLSQDLVESDPTAGLKAYDPGRPRDRVLSAEEIELLWRWLEKSSLSATTADILRMQLLTGARCGEIAGMLGEEIDAAEWFWTLPGTRSKNGKQRVTPLVGMARAIIESRLAGVSHGPLFPSGTGAAMNSAHVGQHLWIRRDKLPITHFATHDLRRSAATHMAKLGLQLDVIASVIGHAPGGKDVRVLVKHYLHDEFIDRKRHALKAWDERLRGIIAGEVKPASNAVEIHRQAG